MNDRLSVSPPRARIAWLSFLLSLGTAVTPLSASAQQAPIPIEARRHLTEGDKAARAKKWEAALDEYKAAYGIAASAQALGGMANALYRLERWAEAYDAYSELLSTYGATLARAPKWEAETRLRDLATKTGTIDVRTTEAGVSIQLDGKMVGTTPTGAPLRVATGAHTVRLTKPGFVPFEVSKDVPPGGAIAIDATLEREVSKGRLVVREKSGASMRVVIDGLDVGATPWEGDVDPGPHSVMVRSSEAASPAQDVEVTKGGRHEVVLVAVPAQARVDVKTADGKGNIYLDGKIVGEGEFSGDVPVGPHVLAVSREGFKRLEKTITLADKQVYSETVTLEREGAVLEGAGSSEPTERALEGFYGGLGLGALFELGGQGTELEMHCSSLGAAQCQTPSPFGGALTGHFGYFLNPVGFEIMLGGMFDTTGQTAIFDGDTSGGANPLVALPARKEDFRFMRGGILGAVKARFMTSGRRVRLTLAAGLGLSYKWIGMKRDAVATDGSGLRDAYVPNVLTILSPAVTADAALMFQLTPTLAITLGAQGWAENAGGDLVVPADSTRYLASDRGAHPIATPAYHLASSTQVFIGPVVGVQFGP